MNEGETPHLESEQFDELVAGVMDELPDEWGPLLENVAVVVEDEPADEDIPDDAPDGASLFGLYRGSAVPVQFLGGGLAGPAMSAPPEIVLFQGPLERASAGLDELRAHVRQTLLHELGHRFGYAEERLGEEAADADDGDEDA